MVAGIAAAAVAAYVLAVISKDSMLGAVLYIGIAVAAVGGNTALLAMTRRKEENKLCTGSRGTGSISEKRHAIRKRE